MGQGPIQDFGLVRDYPKGGSVPDEFFRIHMDVKLVAGDYQVLEPLLVAKRYEEVYAYLERAHQRDPDWDDALATLRTALRAKKA